MRHVTEYSQAKTGEYPRIFPNFQNRVCCKKYLKLTVFLELWSRKTVHFLDQLMFVDKYPCIFSRQMKAIVYIHEIHVK